MKDLSSNIWPKGQWDVKTRVIVALGLLVAGKVRWFVIRNPRFEC